MRDPFDVLREASQVAPDGYKNSRQMCEDFRTVFFGTPAGKRVFHQIMAEAGFFRTAVVRGDPYMTHVKEGERNIGAFVWASCVNEPKELPVSTVKRGKHG